MKARLIYFMGPSGVGKDSLLAWLKNQLPLNDTSLYWARRSITRAVTKEGEQHESLDMATFTALLKDGAFAMHWHANGLAYGIRHQELEPLKRNRWVLMNGSRTHWPEVRQHFEPCYGVLITASPAVLRQRLMRRNRETPSDIETRLARLAGHADSSAHCTIQNNTTLEAAGKSLLTQLQRLEGWPYARHD